MDRLNQRYEMLSKALATLNQSLELYNRAPEEFLKTTRDSSIQRFEYSVDTFWKYLKQLLESKHGLKPMGSPKAIFREANSLDLISAEEYKQLISMIDARNLTSHGYNENLAEDIFSEIPAYHQLLHQLSGRITPI